ncbi:MAG: flagellar hook-basal body protein [Lachnospiraceae bacterium]|nr:flagellar hook-basal body protein [Lachnospiraceae bacterium]
MFKGLYTAYTGLVNEQNRMDVMANSLANVTTVGFKKEGSTSQSFDDILTVKLKDESVGLRTVQRTGINNPGVKIGENYTDYTQGSFRITGNTYDLALSGNGFFAIEFTNKAGETSTKYTRAGQFTLNKEGYLVTQEGDYVLDTQNRRIKLDTLKDSAISTDGTISQDGRAVAKIQVTDFEDYDYLERYGETYFEPVEGAKTVAADAEVNSGYLEMANVQSVQEMVNMIAITRAYESNQKIVQTYDDTMDVAVNQLGRLS